MKSCFFWHDWSSWLDPYQRIIDWYDNGVFISTEKKTVQRRRCSKCNKVEERVV